MPLVILYTITQFNYVRNSDWMTVMQLHMYVRKYVGRYVMMENYNKETSHYYKHTYTHTICATYT